MLLYIVYTYVFTCHYHWILVLYYLPLSRSPVGSSRWRCGASAYAAHATTVPARLPYSTCRYACIAAVVPCLYLYRATHTCNTLPAAVTLPYLCCTFTPHCLHHTTPALPHATACCPYHHLACQVSARAWIMPLRRWTCHHDVQFACMPPTLRLPTLPSYYTYTQPTTCPHFCCPPTCLAAGAYSATLYMWNGR